MVLPTPYAVSMGSLVDYDKHFVKGLGQCGDPFSEFVSFFAQYDKQGATVLDLGCGQGRDALLAAQHGHLVLGVDLSEIGISQMLAAAKRGRHDVEGVVADITEFKSRRKFDVVLLDRVLHCLPSDAERRITLQNACRFTRKRGHLLVADTPCTEG